MQSPSWPAVFIQAGLKNTAIRNALANQGHTARHGTRATARRAGWQGHELQQAGGPGKVWGQQGAQWWAPFQEDLKGEGSPLGGFQQLHPTQQVFDHCKRPSLCSFQRNAEKNTAKNLPAQRQNLLLSPGNFGHQEACIHFY